jgi:guanosine-3',5'-bis(diphosphate) 3'-pyrophosphohydrolase
MKGIPMDRLWNMLHAYLRPLFGRSDILKIKAVYIFADKAHAGQIRDDGSPYITHPVRSVIIAIEAGERDIEVLMAILLHDVYEETANSRYPKKFEHVRENFGQHLAYRVHVLTKYDHSPQGKILYWQGMRKCADHGVKKGKLADRIDNIETLDEVKDESRKKRKLQETVDEFIPILTWLANDIQVKNYKLELERHAELAIVRNLYLRLKRTVEGKYNIPFRVIELE